MLPLIGGQSTIKGMDVSRTRVNMLTLRMSQKVEAGAMVEGTCRTRGQISVGEPVTEHRDPCLLRHP